MLPVGEWFASLEWLQRRKEGESPAQIAARAGISVEVVLRATDPYGPFMSEQDRRRAARNARWVEQRRAGVSVSEIARESGVAHQIVSAATNQHGPFPKPGPPASQVQAWVAARRAGTPLAAIARSAKVSPYRVAKATRQFGPFEQPVWRLPDGVVGLAGVAQIVGVSPPVIATWESDGSLPAPNFTTAKGRRLWLRSAIEAWLVDSGLGTCPVCGARTKSPRRHQTIRHPDPPTDDARLSGHRQGRRTHGYR